MFMPPALLVLFLGGRVAPCRARTAAWDAPWFEVIGTVGECRLLTQYLPHLTLEPYSVSESDVNLRFGIRPISFSPLPAVGEQFSVRVAGLDDMPGSSTAPISIAGERVCTYLLGGAVLMDTTSCKRRTGYRSTRLGWLRAAAHAAVECICTRLFEASSWGLRPRATGHPQELASAPMADDGLLAATRRLEASRFTGTVDIPRSGGWATVAPPSRETGGGDRCGGAGACPAPILAARTITVLAFGLTWDELSEETASWWRAASWFAVGGRNPRSRGAATVAAKCDPIG